MTVARVMRENGVSSARMGTRWACLRRRRLLQGFRLSRSRLAVKTSGRGVVLGAHAENLTAMRLRRKLVVGSVIGWATMGHFFHIVVMLTGSIFPQRSADHIGVMAPAGKVDPVAALADTPIGGMSHRTIKGPLSLAGIRVARHPMVARIR
jgi:hypothetical protein